MIQLFYLALIKPKAFYLLQMQCSIDVSFSLKTIQQVTFASIQHIVSSGAKVWQWVCESYTRNSTTFLWSKVEIERCINYWMFFFLPVGLSQGFLKAVTNKLKGLIVNIKEYLLTEKESRRIFILKVRWIHNDYLAVQGLITSQILSFHLQYWSQQQLQQQ